MTGLRMLNLLNRDHRRGAEAFAIDLGRALDGRGLEVRTVALTRSGSGPAFSVDALTATGSTRWTKVRALRRATAAADIAVGHGGQTLLTGALASLRGGPPFVYRVIGEPQYWAEGRAREAMVRWALGRTAKVVVYYPAIAEQLTAQFGLGRDHVEVIPKGLDTRVFSPTDPSVRLQARDGFGLAYERPVVAYVGALTEAKNIEQLVAATRLLDDVVLLVVGDGPGRAALEREALASAGRIVVAGALDDPRLAYGAADVVALTSRTEGVPTVLLEAALSGLPTVTTAVGGADTVVDDDVTGYVVPLDDPAATAQAIERAVAHRHRLGTAARARGLERFDIRTIASRWDQLLHTVTADASRIR